MAKKVRPDEAFELLRSVLGATVIEVRETVTGRVIWKKPLTLTCEHKAEGVDSR